MISGIVTKRLLAWVIDFGIIAIYATLLFLVTSYLMYFFNWNTASNPLIGQFIGLLTLTFPVYLYSFLLEKSKWRGTFGKKLLNIKVLSHSNKKGKSILYRNLLKYLPWEIAHTGVHWSQYYFQSGNEQTPIWIWIVLILPQVIVLLYFISILIYRGESSIYDKIANTRLQVKQ